MAKTQTRSTSDKHPRTPPGGRYRDRGWLLWTAGLAAAAVVLLWTTSKDDAPAPGATVAKPVVGGDLHSLVVDPSNPEVIYIGSHQGVSVSRDGGESWEVESSLDGADAMGWAFTERAVLVGGHPGLYVSADDGATFELRNEGLPSTDLHALGAGGGVLYAASPAAGLLASNDGGRSWEVRTDRAGHGFMGRILVDPSDPEHLIASDMGAGAVESGDGGRTWDALGGVGGAMWVTWDVSDTTHLIVTGQGSAAASSDGGKTWGELEIPKGASIVEFDPHDADVLYAAVLQDPEAAVYVSRDGGATWTKP